MEELEFWVYIGKKIGIDLKNFRIIKEESINNYKAIQESLNRTQQTLCLKFIDDQSDITKIENHLQKLSNAIIYQESVIIFKSLLLFFDKLEEECNSVIKKTKIRLLVKICKQVKKRLDETKNPILQHLVGFAVEQARTYQHTLLSKL